VKGLAVLGIFTDPAGDSIGLVELTNESKTKIPRSLNVLLRYHRLRSLRDCADDPSP